MKFMLTVTLYIVLQFGSLFLGDYFYYLNYGHSIMQCQLNKKCR